MGLLLPSLAHAQWDTSRPPGLFRPPAGTVGLYATQARHLNVLENQPMTKGTHFVRLPDMLADHRAFRLYYQPQTGFVPSTGGRTPILDANGRIIEARRTTVDVLSDTSYAWIGNLHAKREDTGQEGRIDSMILIQEKSGRVTGSIRVGAEHFKLRALGRDGLDVFVDVDEGKIPSPETSPSAGNEQRNENRTGYDEPVKAWGDNKLAGRAPGALASKSGDNV